MSAQSQSLIGRGQKVLPVPSSGRLIFSDQIQPSHLSVAPLISANKVGGNCCATTIEIVCTLKVPACSSNLPRRCWRCV